MPSGVGTTRSLQPTMRWGGAAFVDMDVGSIGTDHGMVRTAHGIDRKNVGAGAVENEINRSLRAEEVAKELLCSQAVFVVAIGEGMVDIGRGEGLENFGRESRVVVRTESAFHNDVVLFFIYYIV